MADDVDHLMAGALPQPGGKRLPLLHQMVLPGLASGLYLLADVVLKTGAQGGGLLPCLVQHLFPATVEDATLGLVGSRLAAHDTGSVFVGGVISGTGPLSTPPAEVLLEVGPIGADQSSGPRTTRPVEMTVITPHGRQTRVFDFGGDDERLRAFAVIAALHMLRTALRDPPRR
jgi:hypothetical protein